MGALELCSQQICNKEQQNTLLSGNIPSISVQKWKLNKLIHNYLISFIKQVSTLDYMSTYPTSYSLSSFWFDAEFQVNFMDHLSNCIMKTKKLSISCPINNGVVKGWVSIFWVSQPSSNLSSNSVIYRGGSHVFASIWYLRLVGVVGTADHWAGGGEAVAPHDAATGLAWRHSSLPQLPVARASRTPFGVHDRHGGPAFVVEDSRAETHRDSHKEYSVYMATKNR